MGFFLADVRIVKFGDALPFYGVVALIKFGVDFPPLLAFNESYELRDVSLFNVFLPLLEPLLRIAICLAAGDILIGLPLITFLKVFYYGLILSNYSLVGYNLSVIYLERLDFIFFFKGVLR